VFLLWSVQRELFNGLAAAIGIPVEWSSLGLLIGLAPIAAGVLFHHFTHLYELEGGQRLRATRGFIARVRREFTLSPQVQVDLRQTAMGRLLNYGSVRFWTGDDRSGLEWTNVKDPAGLVDAVHAVRTPDGTGEAASPATPATPATPARPTIEAAKRTRRTGFGPAVPPRAEATGPTVVPTTIETPFGHYTAHADGTVGHRESGLSIVRAPWGMVWDGTRFHGEPIRLPWGEAVRLFGRGVEVPYSVGDSMDRFDAAKQHASAVRHGYRNGICRVDFAGFEDWRLPTAVELSILLVTTATGDEPAPGDAARGWTWGAEHNARVVRELYPEFSAAPPALWTATGLGDALAWGFDGTLPPGDLKTRIPMGVMLVRSDRGVRD
jgi:hypothetical protein